MRNVGDTLTPSELSCDVCCLLYDVSNPRSFEFVAKIYLVRNRAKYFFNHFDAIKLKPGVCDFIIAPYKFYVNVNFRDILPVRAKFQS